MKGEPFDPVAPAVEQSLLVKGWVTCYRLRRIRYGASGIGS